MVNLTIDGTQVTVPKSFTIYQAAEQIGIKIPVLCYAKKLLPFGACRVCLVEVEQMKGRLIPSCTTPVTEGMVVTTSSDEILKVRKTVLEFLLVNHVIECPVCDKGGECELQDLTYELEVVTNRFVGEKFDHPTDESNPFIERNMNRCVLCGRCVRVCDEIVSYGSYSFVERGFETKIATAFDRGLDCEFCGQCVSMCPVGALLPRPFKFKARPWQLKHVDSVCGYCGNGCTVTLGVKDNQVQTIRFNDKNGVNDGNLCIRGRFGYSYVNSDQRLTRPLVRKNGELVEADWEEALTAVAEGMSRDRGTGIISGGRLSNEEFLLLKEVAAAAGTTNLDHSGGECYKGLTEGVQQVLGLSASTGTFPQVEDADVILSIRSDFYETHPVFGMVVNQAVKRAGAKLLVVSDKKGKFAKLPNAETLLGKPGTEVNILNAICAALLESGKAVTEGVAGLDELKQALTDYAPSRVAEQTGVSVEAIEAAAEQLAAAEKGAILLGYGLSYTANSRELGIAAANLALLSGLADQDEAGLYVCGEKANSQGAIDLGILPGEGGLGVQAMLDAAAKGSLGALYIVGEDPLTSFPDGARVEAALKGAEFVVVQDLFLSPTAQAADVVLPAASFAEKDGTFTNAERRIQRLRAGIKSPGEALTDFAIFVSLLEKLGATAPVANPSDAFNNLGRLNEAYAGIDLNAIGPQGVVWGGEHLQPKVRNLVPVSGCDPLTTRFQLITGSALYHSGTTTTHAKGPLEAVPEPYVELSREDAAELQLAEGDLLRIKGNGAEISLKAKIGARLPKGVLFAPNHFPGTGLNRLYKGEAAVVVELNK
ncbi:NADH-quinone oxidoreductase subunit NuoG [Geothermobacter hydrogeniphilus]|uniref:NADH dehydrogenase (Quinone) subunit G n=1 Tax=Geothermobacter hydrogeniphilus TaxID=1969733 RepID=A0A1X0XX36_9BACT|nr:NADH-quinone oxidoreductase subunit NuoG [Geothermobacter hydrogeniphilus]ORJ57455.1 NADH dehydrogenase (quinone) subunit G [Geothermobacter hydrogeniphilus]